MSLMSNSDLDAVRADIQNVQQSLTEEMLSQRDDIDRTLLKLMEKV